MKKKTKKSEAGEKSTGQQQQCVVLTHVTDLEVGIPSIPPDTTNGLCTQMMALINNTFPLNALRKKSNAFSIKTTYLVLTYILI